MLKINKKLLSKKGNVVTVDTNVASTEIMLDTTVVENSLILTLCVIRSLIKPG